MSKKAIVKEIFAFIILGSFAVIAWMFIFRSINSSDLGNTPSEVIKPIITKDIENNKSLYLTEKNLKLVPNITNGYNKVVLEEDMISGGNKCVSFFVEEENSNIIQPIRLCSPQYKYHDLDEYIYIEKNINEEILNKKVNEVVLKNSFKLNKSGNFWLKNEIINQYKERTILIPKIYKNELE